jgi:ATP-dependent DNA helicase PIF1
MLIKNIDDELVNGCVGKVIGFKDPSSYAVETGTTQPINRAESGTLYPEVQFTSGNLSFTRLISPQTWKVTLPNGEVEASRTQVICCS